MSIINLEGSDNPEKRRTVWLIRHDEGASAICFSPEPWCGWITSIVGSPRAPKIYSAVAERGTRQLTLRHNPEWLINNVFDTEDAARAAWAREQVCIVRESIDRSREELDRLASFLG